MRLFWTVSLLFPDTPKGAQANAIAYSIVETTKLNNLNVFEYLNIYLKIFLI